MLWRTLKRMVRAFRKPLDHLARMWVRWEVSSLGPRCVVLGFPIIDEHPKSEIHLGHRVVLCSRPSDTALGVSRPVILRTLSPRAEIRIGDDTGMSGTTVCAAVSVVIGRGCLFGADVMVVDTDFHPLGLEGRRYAREGVASAPVHIGDNVFLGARTLVLKGVSIGDNTVVGAGSVVTRSLPADVIAAGNPVRVLRSLDPTRIHP